MQTVAIFCGARPGHSKTYEAIARRLVEELFQRNITIVYGGSSVGLMKVIADHMLALGGEIVGVFPKGLVKIELPYQGLTRLDWVDDFSTRKARMATLSDGFIALPGGFGTLDEVMEMLVMNQIGDHDKPCALLNHDGYYQSLLDFFDHTMDEGFVSAAHRDNLFASADPADLVQVMIDRMVLCRKS